VNASTGWQVCKWKSPVDDDRRLLTRINRRLLAGGYGPIEFLTFRSEPPPMATLETDTLAELIGAKCECLRQIRNLGRRQFELIEADEMTPLLDLLAVKQRSLLRLQQIERALDPLRNQDAEQRRWRSPEARQACAEQLSRCEALLREIVAQEKRSESTLCRRRDEAAARLQGLHVAGAARGAYAAQAAAEQSQLDLLSDT
jgi:hypothetical protein